MGSLKTIAFAGAVLVGATVSATAADFGPRHAPPPPPPVPVATPIAEASGWYLRGDIGIAHQDMKPTLDDRRFVPPSVSVHDFSQSKVPFVGIGAGYQWNSWLRTDVTAEYRLQSRFSFEDKSCFGTNALGALIATPGAACATTAGFSGIDNRNYYNGRISSTVVLFNAYLDLGNWSGFTPFIGAGIGYASHQISNLSDIGVGYNYAAGVATGTSSSGLVRFANRSQGSVAYALMAGVGFDLSSNAKLELGYRYLNMGRVRGQSLACANSTCGDFMNYRDIHAHEFKLGVRYMFGAPSYAAAAPVYHPGHVVKRY
jgi:opacity protein-like surface antigen